jgi:antitoxin HicB
MTSGTARRAPTCGTVWAALTTALDRGITIPEPETYSGKFVLRVPKSLHRKLAENARRENLSLNQFLIYLITEQNEICTMKLIFPKPSLGSR